MTNLDVRARNLLVTGYESLCVTCMFHTRRIHNAGTVMFFVCLKYNRKMNPSKIKCKKYVEKKI